MSITYILSHHGRLIRKGEVLQLKKEEDICNTIFPHKTEQIVIIGRVEITHPAFQLLMKHRIETVFLGTNGRFNGKLEFQTGKNVFLRRRQFQLLDDTSFCLEFSRSVTLGKLKNQLNFMQRIKRKQPGKPPAHLLQAVQDMERTLAAAEQAESPASLRGLEGTGARLYFSILPLAIQPEFARFNGRSKHPPKDNVNAVLSFLYTLIFYRVAGALEAAGLDSHVGYFHAIDYGKRTLAFDLMEEYRTPIADTLTVSLFNLDILKPEDFRTVPFSPEDAEYPLEPDPSGQPPTSGATTGILLTKEALRKVITQFERKLDTAVYYPPADRSLPYRQILNRQVDHFKRVLNGHEQTYKPFLVR